MRRSSWGRDTDALVKRARRVFGAPSVYTWLVTTGLRVRAVKADGVDGEWILPRGVPGEEAAVLYIHGGGYVSCSRRTHRPITTALARRTGIPVFSIDYRLAPEHPFPAALDDVVAAYRWLLGTGTPPSGIGLAGDSAGGGLVLGLLLRIRDEGLAMPACAVCFSPLADLTARGASVQQNAGRDHMFVPENTEAFAQAYLGAQSRTMPHASMVNADVAGWPPMLFQVAATELLLDDARVMHERVLAAGGSSRLTVYGDLLHCWQMLAGIVPEADAALDEAAAFLRSHLVDARDRRERNDGGAGAATVASR